MRAGCSPSQLLMQYQKETPVNPLLHRRLAPERIIAVHTATVAFIATPLRRYLARAILSFASVATSAFQASPGDDSPIFLEVLQPILPQVSASRWVQPHSRAKVVNHRS